MLLTKNKIIIQLTWLFILFFSYSYLFGQINKQSDSLLLSISEKLDVIDKKLANNQSSTKESEKDVDLKKENKELKKQIEDLKKQASIQTSQISEDKKQLDSINAILKTENSKLDQELIKQKLTFQVKDKEIQELNDREKAALEKEIAAILNQGYTLTQNLIISLQERSFESKAKPSNHNLLEDFSTAHKKINDVYPLLNSVYDGDKIKEALGKIEKINLDATIYSGLLANKKELSYLLSKYCERTNELSKIIEDAKVKLDETKRQEWLEGFTFKTKGIPYLAVQLEKAVKDRNYKLEKVNCQ